jgi:antitoxin VapB
MPQFAKVFQLGNFQAVRLPDGFHLHGDEIEVSREGDTLILRPRSGVSGLRASWDVAINRGVSDDFFSEGRQQPGNQKRPDLDWVFP